MQASFGALAADAALQRGVSALGGPAEVHETDSEDFRWMFPGNYPFTDVDIS